MKISITDICWDLTVITYLLGVRGNIVPYDFELGDCRSVVLEIFQSEKISRQGKHQQMMIEQKANSYRADSTVSDATISFPALADRATEVGPPEDVALGSSTGTSNDGFRIVMPALPIPISHNQRL